MEALVHLQEYAKSTESANSELKSCLWHLTKARKSHSRGGLLTCETSFTAEQLREEFAAQVFLAQEEKEPNLVEEDKNEKVQPSPTKWILKDKIQKTKKKQETSSKISSDSNALTESSDGLRQRKNKERGDGTNEPQKWTIIEETNEQEILNSDPLNLFGGLTPKELRLAQKNAKQALEHYIQAANSVASILAQLPSIETKDK